MPSPKLPLALVCVLTLTTIFHYSNAQNSPQDFLDAHNEARATVGVGEMVWNTTVEAYAQNYADSMSNGACSQLVHSSGPYGENLAAGSGSFTGTAAVKMWVDEQVNYDYATNTCATGKECGHYTQVVWANSVSLGCARALCNDGWWFVICNYDPRGNWNGEWPY